MAVRKYARDSDWRERERKKDHDYGCRSIIEMLDRPGCEIRTFERRERERERFLALAAAAIDIGLASACGYLCQAFAGQPEQLTMASHLRSLRSRQVAAAAAAAAAARLALPGQPRDLRLANRVQRFFLFFIVRLAPLTSSTASASRPAPEDEDRAK